MAVVQDGAAPAARAGKPLCAAAVSVSAVRTDLGWVNCAMVQAVRGSPVGSARGSPTVERHPVRNSVTAVAQVVRAVQATPDFGGELSLLIGITGRKVSPCGRGDETGEADGFGIDRREQPGGAERRRLGARRDEDLGAAGPVANTDALLASLRAEVAAEQEPGQHRRAETLLFIESDPAIDDAGGAPQPHRQYTGPGHPCTDPRTGHKPRF